MKGKKNFYKYLSLFFIALVVFVVPLIVFGKYYELSDIEYYNWYSGTHYIDFFSYWKSVYLIIFSSIAFILFIIHIFFNPTDFVKTKLYIPLSISLIFTLLSSIFAVDRGIAFTGIVDQFQGFFVILSYHIIVFILINLIRTKFDLNFVILPFFALIFVIGFIGVFQYIGKDIFNTDFGKRLILPDNLHHLIPDLSFRFGENTIYATMYNTNFVGSFAALVIPITLVYFLKTPLQPKSILYLVLLFFGLVLLLGSNSRAGMIGLTSSILLFIITLPKLIYTNIHKLLITGIIGFIVFLTFNHISDGRIKEEVMSLNLINEIARVKEANEDKLTLEEIFIDGNELTVITSEKDIVVRYDYEFIFLDTDDNILDFTFDGTEIRITTDGYTAFRFELNNQNATLRVRYSHIDFTLVYTDNGFVHTDRYGNHISILEPNRIEFLDGYETLFSSRIYIWSRAIPLLNDYMLLGAGPDNFTLVFPQEDIIGRSNSIRFNTLIDKPHNMYIQMAINNSFITLIAFISLIILSFFKHLKVAYNDSNRTTLYALLFGMVGYLGAGIFNDQIISVAPIFYVILGAYLGLVVKMDYLDTDMT